MMMIKYKKERLSAADVHSEKDIYYSRKQTSKKPNKVKKKEK
jgi:hypothetical protein